MVPRSCLEMAAALQEAAWLWERLGHAFLTRPRTQSDAAQTKKVLVSALEHSLTRPVRQRGMLNDWFKLHCVLGKEYKSPLSRPLPLQF